MFVLVDATFESMQTQVIRFIWKNLRKNRFIRPFVLGYPPLGEDLSRLFLRTIPGDTIRRSKSRGEHNFQRAISRDKRLSS